jgi:DNA-binding transcriptional regulator YhcF (GntR family)
MEQYEIAVPRMAAPFAMLYGPVIVDHQLNDAALRLYSLLWCLGDRFKQGWHSQKLLADLLQVSTRKIRRGLKNLDEAGLIEQTVRRPRPTLIKIVDPAEIYGVFMVQFYDYVKDRSAALRPEGGNPKAEAPNRTNLSHSIGQNCPTKNIKGSTEKCADSRRRASVDDSMETVEQKVSSRKSSRKSRSPRKKKVPGLRIPTMTPRNPSRWGGGKFYLYCLQCASVKGVPVRDPAMSADHAPPRFAREMNYAIEAYQNDGYSKSQFLELLTTIFENWTYFAKYFKKEQFSVYDLRYARIEIGQMFTNIKAKSSLDAMDDFEDKPRQRSRRKGKVIYDDE